MTDYLEEHLGSAEVLLERIRQLEQSVSGSPDRTKLKENMVKHPDFGKKRQDVEVNRNIVSDIENMVYDIKNNGNLTNKTVDKSEIDPKIREKEQDTTVNYKMKIDDDSSDPEQSKTVLELMEETSKPEETQTNVDRAERRSPLSVQLETLDRAVSALSAMSSEGRDAARSSWSAYAGVDNHPVSLSAPRGSTVNPDITGVTGGEWIGPGTAARADSTCGGTPSWAEQTDRMFRRDSRRYDGGFYLY